MPTLSPWKMWNIKAAIITVTETKNVVRMRIMMLFLLRNDDKFASSSSRRRLVLLFIAKDSSQY